MLESREQLLAKADECERLAQQADSEHLRRRHAALSCYWVALAGAAAPMDGSAAPRRTPALDEAA